MKKYKKLVQAIIEITPFGERLRNLFCNKFKIVRMHEKRSHCPHSLLYQVGSIPSERTIKQTVATAYGTHPSNIVIDSIDPYKRMKDAPLHEPTAASVKKAARFAPVTHGRVGDVIYQPLHADTLREEQIDLARCLP